MVTNKRVITRYSCLNNVKEIEMKEHTKGARPSTWDKHSDRDKGLSQDKIKGNREWVHQGKRTNSKENQDRKQENIKKFNTPK